MTTTSRKKLLTVVVFEVAMLLGILVALFTVPRKTPLMTFTITSVVIFILGNIVLVRSLKRVQTEPSTDAS